MRLLVALFSCTFLLSANAQTVVFTEDFQSGIPATWTLIDNDGNTPAAAVSEYTEAWISKTDPDSAANQTASSTSFFDPSGTADRWLISPALSLSGFGNILSWKAKSHDASFPDGYFVLISTTGTEMVDFIDTMKIVSFELEHWTSHSVSLSDSGYNNQIVHIAFILRSADAFKLYIDDVELVNDDPSSVAERLAQNWQLSGFGNGEFNILIDAEILNVQTTNLQGQEIGTYDKNSNVLRLPSGYSIVSVETEHGLVRKQIVVD
jgi:hypothetical protein